MRFRTGLLLGLLGLAVVAALAVFLNGRDERPKRVEAPTPALPVAAPAPAPAPPPAPKAAPLKAAPAVDLDEQAQIAEDAAAVGMTTSEPEPEEPASSAGGSSVGGDGNGL